MSLRELISTGFVVGLATELAAAALALAELTLADEEELGLNMSGDAELIRNLQENGVEGN